MSTASNRDCTIGGGPPMHSPIRDNLSASMTPLAAALVSQPPEHLRDTRRERMTEAAFQ